MDHVFCLTKKRSISGKRGSTYGYHSTINNKLSLRLVGMVVWLVIDPAQTADSQTLR
jgi:hypothetical protein